MNLRQLSYFVGVVVAGSFSRAAIKLHVAQPALSQQISNLEKELGTELLTRSQLGARPTAAGIILYRSARAVMNEVDHVRQTLRASGELVGTVSLGLTSSFSGTFAAPIASAVLARYPGIRLDVVDGPSHNHEDSLLRGTLDMAVLTEDVASSKVRRQPLYQQVLFFVERRPPRTAALGDIRMSDLARRKLVLPGMPNPTRAVIETACLALGTKPLVVAQANSRASLLSMVANGIGGTVLAWSGAPDPVLRWSRIIDPSISHEVSLCTARLLPHNEAVEALHQIVQEVIMGMVRSPTWKGAMLTAAGPS
jgi:LysR family nitrogen assimilation transcriptional regulator